MYLQQLNELYDAWIEDFALCPVLTIPADDLDFVRFNGHLDVIAGQVLEKLKDDPSLAFEPVFQNG